MNFQWILLALFLIAIVSNIAKAMRNPMLKNFLRLISIIVAFIITFILQFLGVFQGSVAGIVDGLELASQVPQFEGAIANSIHFILPFCTTFLSPLIFTLVFAIIYFFLKLIHVNLVYRFIVKRQRRREIKELKYALKEEKRRMKQAISDNEERFLDAMEKISMEHPEIDEYEYDSLDDEEIERMVEARIKAEKKRKKKSGFFRESRERKALSIVCGVVCGFLLFGISYMGLFYTMDVLADVTDIAKDTNAKDTKFYQIVEVIDKHIVDPYEDSFVYDLYDSMAMVDLMNYTVRAGGKFEFEGKTYYADDISREQLGSVIRLACEMTAGETEHIRYDINVLTTKYPMTTSIMADFFVALMEDVEPAELDPSNPASAFMGGIIENYKGENAREIFIQDLHAMSDLVVVAAENKLLSKVISENSDFGAILADREMLADLVGAMSGLSFYGTTMESAFKLGIDMVGPMLMPLDNAEGYQKFIDKLASATDGASAITSEDMEKLHDMMVDATISGNLLAYMREPIDYIFDVIKPKALDIKSQMEEKAADILDISTQLEDVTSLTPEKIQELNDLLNLYKDEELALLEQEKALFDETQKLLEDFQKRATAFAPFIKYFMAWNNIQKPFMLADEDTSTACLAVIVGDETYVCTTDIITIETLLDLVLENNDFGDLIGGEGQGGGEVSTEFEQILNLTADDYINKIPESMRNLLESLEITNDMTSMEGRVSELTHLVHYIIVSANVHKNNPESTPIDNEWIYKALYDYCALGNTPEASTDMARRLFDAKNAPESFEYKGVTVAKMEAAMNFGEGWDAQARKEDSEKLVNITFTLLDLMKNMNGEEAEAMSDINSGFDNVDNDEIQKLLDLLVTLGSTMDQMADTTCLKDLPPIMIEGILKNDMLSMAMTPSLLHGEEGYLSQIKSGDLSYEEFMGILAEDVEGILEKVNQKNENSTNEEEETV